MEKAMAAAIADELLDTVIHKFQIPGSGTQVKVQATAIKELMRLLEEHAGIRFHKGTDHLVDVVAKQMPGCTGMVPHDFYALRNTIEGPLKEDPFLRHVVNVHTIRGDRSDLYCLLPILKDPNVPQELKDNLTDGGIMFLPDSGTMDSVKALIEEMGGEYKEKMLAQIAPHIGAAEQSNEIKEATMAGDFEALRNIQLDEVGLREVSARADAVLDSLFCHWRSKFYDERR